MARYPTANSVVNDIVRVAQDKTASPFPLSYDPPIDNDYSARFYGLGIIRHIGDAAESSHVSISSILQNPITNPAVVDILVTTEECKLSQVGGSGGVTSDLDAWCALGPDLRLQVEENERNSVSSCRY